MNSIDSVNYLSCTILGLKTALFEAEKENRCLQKLLLSFYVKDAAKETDLYKMSRTGVKMNGIFQKEKQDLSLKIQELEAKLTVMESENVNLNFQVRELKAFLEEKTNLLELYNAKDAKSEKLLLNNLKEKDLIQIIRNVLVCMKKGRVSRTLQKSLRRLEQKRNRNLKKIKTEDTDAEISDGEIDLMSAVIENRLEEDDLSFKCEKNESFMLPCIHESSEMPTIDLNESDITGAETNSSHGNAMDCIPVDQPILSPLSIADSDYSSNGIKSVESLNSEKVQSAESCCSTNILLSEVDIKSGCDSSIVLAEGAAKRFCEIDILEPKLNAERRCGTILPVGSDLNPSYKIILPLEEDPKRSCETILPSELNEGSRCETNTLPAENIVRANRKTDGFSEEEDPQSSCEPHILPLMLNEDFRCETNALAAESIVNLSCKTDVFSEEEDPKPSYEIDNSSPAELNSESRCETNALPAESIVKPSSRTDSSYETNISPPELYAKLIRETNTFLSKSHGEPNFKFNLLPVALDSEPNCENNISTTERDLLDSIQKSVTNSAEASVDIVQSDDSVTDPEEILDCPFIDPKIVDSVADLIVSEMIDICYSSPIVESFREFCKSDIRLNSDQTSVRVQNADESLSSEGTSSNLATLLVPQDVSHELILVKRKIDDSSQNSDLKKFRLNENVTNLSAGSSVLDIVPEENTNVDQIHSLEDETNPNTLTVQDEKPENTISSSLLENCIIKVDSKLELQTLSIVNNAIIQDVCELPDVLLSHPDKSSDVSSSNNKLALNRNPSLEISAGDSNVQLEIGSLESQLDKHVISRSDSQVSPRRPVKSIFDVEFDSTDCESTSVSNEGISASIDQDNSSASLEKKSDSDMERLEIIENTNQVEDTEFINDEVPVTADITSIREAGKDLFCILNEFASLGEEMHRRITVFKEFLLQEDNYGAIEVFEEMEYIVVAEILENNDLELSARETFIDGSCLPDYVLNSLHKTSLKTVELQNPKENWNSDSENRSAEEKFFVPAFDSMAEVNDTSDDEKDELIIVEDNHVDGNSFADTAFSKGGGFHNEENIRESDSVDASKKQISNSRNVHSVLKKDQPIKEITNVPRYNFRRSAAFTDSASGTSRSLQLLPVDHPAHSSECSRESVTSTVEEPSKTIQMQFYVENQTPLSNSSLYVSVFDEVWSQIKLDGYENPSLVTSDTKDLMPCRTSIMKFVFLYKDPQTGLKMKKEKVLDVTGAKKTLEAFLQEKIRNYAHAFDVFSSTVSRSNKTTLCCAMTELILDSGSSSNTRRNENILRDFVNLSFKLDSTIFQGFVDALKNELKTRMETKNYKMKDNGSLVKDLRLLSKFFTRLCKSNNDSHGVISLLREILLGFKYRAHPVAFSVLKEWPDVFPCDAQERNMVVHIILFTLVNHRMDYNQELYNVAEVQELIFNLFNVKLGMKAAEEYAKELMLQFCDPMWEDAITLLCKRQMFPWTYTNVIMKYLLPILKKWKKELFSEEILSQVLRALKTLIAACPLKDEENEMFKLDVIVNTLEEILSGKGSRELKENVILVLCELSVFRFSLCVAVLENWKPEGGVIRRSTFQLLKDQLRKYRPAWEDFLFPMKNSGRTRENKREGIGGVNGVRANYSSHPNNTHATIAVGVSKRMIKNRALPNQLLRDNPIPSKGKKKKKSKKKRKVQR